jgi:hypothetical protein
VAGDWYSRPDPVCLSQPAVSSETAWQAVGRQPISEGNEDLRFAFYRYCRQSALRRTFRKTLADGCLL